MQQVEVDERFEEFVGLGFGAAEQRGRAGQRDVRGVGQGQQAEGAGEFGVEAVVGEGEGGLHGPFAVAEFGQPVFPAQPVGERGQGERGVGGEPGGDDAHGERQQSAGPHDLLGGPGFGVDAVGADDPGQQFQCLGGRQGVQAHLVRPGEAGQPDAAGDQDGAAGRAGQQWFDLAEGGGVVEDDEDPPPGQCRAVEGGALPGVERDLGGGHAEGAQEAGEHRARVQRGAVGAAQVGEEPPVGEASVGLSGDVHSECGLADPAHAVQGGDHDGSPAGPGEAVHQGLDLLGAAGEVGQAVGQLVGRLPGGGGFGADGGGGGGGGQQGRVLAQDPQVQCGGAVLGRRSGGGRRRPAGVLVPGGPVPAGRQSAAGVLVHGERLGLAARLVEGAHQDGGQPGPFGVFQGECGGLGRQTGVVADLRVQLQPRLLGVKSLFGEAGADGLGVRPGQPGQRFADPQPLRGQQDLPDLLRRGLLVAQPSGRGQQFLPAGRVHLRVRHPQRVPVADPHQRHPLRIRPGVRLEGRTQPGDGQLDGLAGVGRCGPAPHPLHQHRRRHRPSGGVQQHRQDGPLLRSAQFDLPLPVPGAQWSQQSEPQPGRPDVNHVPSPNVVRCPDHATSVRTAAPLIRSPMLCHGLCT